VTDNSPGKKAARTKGPAELAREGRAAGWTRKHGKDDARNPHSRINKTTRGPATWIFQCNPKRFDVDGYLAFAPDRMTWLAAQGKKQMRLGDQVFLWRSKLKPSDANSGIVAELRIDSDVSNMPDVPGAEQFWRDPADYREATDRVWLRVVRVAGGSMLRRSELVKDPALAKAGPIGFGNATNFKLTEQESRRLNQLWLAERREISRESIDEAQSKRVAGLEERSLDELMAEYRKRQQGRAGMQPRSSIVSTVVFERDDYVKAIARKRADHKCEIPSCTAVAFLDDHGIAYCEVHHIKPLAEGGPDTIENAACVCPGHHRELHLGRNRAELAALLLKARARDNAVPR
jgi:hypothetical protein